MSSTCNCGEKKTPSLTGKNLQQNQTQCPSTSIRCGEQRKMTIVSADHWQTKAAFTHALNSKIWKLSRGAVCGIANVKVRGSGLSPVFPASPLVKTLDNVLMRQQQEIHWRIHHERAGVLMTFQTLNRCKTEKRLKEKIDKYRSYNIEI